jgi:small subunit ribosomal protein S20
MPITTSAKKALRASHRKRVFNLRRNRTMKEAVQEIRKLVATSNTTEASNKMPNTYKAIDKATKRGVIKKNTANRKKARLMALIKRSGQSA